MGQAGVEMVELVTVRKIPIREFGIFQSPGGRVQSDRLLLGFIISLNPC